MLCIDGVRQYRRGASLVGSNHDGQQFSGYRMKSLIVKSPDRIRGNIAVQKNCKVSPTQAPTGGPWPR